MPSANLLPDTKVSLPEINAANVDLRYRGEKIINRDVPLDNVVVHLTIVNGRITVDPLNFAVGTGTIASDIVLNPVGGVLHAKANIDFRQLQLARLMAATHTFAGDGTVGGSAYLAGTGNSVAEILGHGNGHASFYLQNGADVSALLVDLAGLQVGDAILSALGIPVKTHDPVPGFGFRPHRWAGRYQNLPAGDQGGEYPGVRHGQPLHRATGPGIAHRGDAFLDRLAFNPDQYWRYVEKPQHPAGGRARWRNAPCRPSGLGCYFRPWRSSRPSG